MTRWIKYGETNELYRMNEEKWEAREAATESTPLTNEAIGTPIILRRFQFKAPPDIKNWPTEKHIKESHQKAIEMFLWKDELVLVEDLRVVINTKDKSFDIFATCQPRRNATMKEKPKTLQDVLKPK